MTVRHVPVAGGTLEVDDLGTGDPVLLVQTALTADELRPLAEAPDLAGFRRLLLHRRGYAGSSPADGPGSIPRDAQDCRTVLDALDLRSGHVVGLSYSGAVAMQLAADAPARVATLTLVEPPPVHVPSAPTFREVNDELQQVRRARGPQVALEEFLRRLIGPDWRREVDDRLPGASTQMARDVGTFFDVDLPALLAWRFGPDDAARIRCPVLHVGGTASGQWFAEVRRLLLDWFPDAEDVRVEGADHNLALTHAGTIATAVAAFLRRHPVRDDDPLR